MEDLYDEYCDSFRELFVGVPESYSMFVDQVA
jgi:hypothetical protein